MNMTNMGVELHNLGLDATVSQSIHIFSVADSSSVGRYWPAFSTGALRSLSILCRYAQLVSFPLTD